MPLPLPKNRGFRRVSSRIEHIGRRKHYYARNKHTSCLMVTVEGDHGIPT